MSFSVSPSHLLCRGLCLSGRVSCRHGDARRPSEADVVTDDPSRRANGPCVSVPCGCTTYTRPGSRSFVSRPGRVLVLLPTCPSDQTCPSDLVTRRGCETQPRVVVGFPSSAPTPDPPSSSTVPLLSRSYVFRVPVSSPVAQPLCRPLPAPHFRRRSTPHPVPHHL